MDKKTLINALSRAHPTLGDPDYCAALITLLGSPDAGDNEMLFAELTARLWYERMIGEHGIREAGEFYNRCLDEMEVLAGLIDWEELQLLYPTVPPPELGLILNRIRAFDRLTITSRAVLSGESFEPTGL